MKTVLTGELAIKRQRIARSHNLRLIGLLALMFVPVLPVLAFRQLPRGIPYASWICLGLIIVLEAGGIYSIVQHDNRLCRELGFMCPFCGKPLYENRALIWNTLCPKCGKDIQPRHESEPCPARPS